MRKISDQLTFWSEESPASPPASLDAEREAKTKDGYGPTFFDWPQKRYPAGSWQRTLLESLQSNLTASSGSTKGWNRRVTRSARSLWVLTSVEHPIDAIAPGLSPSWPTPTAQDSENAGGLGSIERGNRGFSLYQAARHWPTPTVCGNHNRAGASPSSGDGLSTAAKMWPTPTAAEYGSSNNGNPGDTRTEYATKGRPSLSTMAKTDSWPTPKAADGRAKGNGGNRHSPGLDQMARQNDPAMADWATPTAHDARRPGLDTESTQHANLSRQIGDWATPLARDSRTFQGAARMPNSQGGDPLSVQISQLVGQPAEASLNTTGNPPESSISRIRLSALWVACLMGLPPGWGCVSIERCSKLWGTGSSRKSRSKSDSPSPDAKG